ncbi:unnamed protein product [Peronospora belbahrii]|uniref:Uncharacterized protein n=1 Tax=Peronospora belbahrii TaxID=622444 RepID=A0ABN8D2V0_9STRA|nr:unnamed protein product [Peronospora belbahrii]
MVLRWRQTCQHRLRDTYSATAASRASPCGLFGAPQCSPAGEAAYEALALESLVCPQGPGKDGPCSWWFGQWLLDSSTRDVLSRRRLRAHARCRYPGCRWKKSLAHVLNHCPGTMDAIRGRHDDHLKIIERTLACLRMDIMVARSFASAALHKCQAREILYEYGWPTRSVMRTRQQLACVQREHTKLILNRLKQELEHRRQKIEHRKQKLEYRKQKIEQREHNLGPWYLIINLHSNT